MAASIRSQPPGLIGLALLRQVPAIQKNPLAFLQYCAQQFGDIVYFEAGQQSVFFINHPDFIRHVLQENYRNFNKRTIQYNQLATITGRGLLTNDGEDWLRQRRLAQPAFHKSRLEHLASTVVSAAQALVDRWRAAQPTVIDIDEAMLELSLEIVGKTLFSLDLRHEAHTLTQATLAVLDHIVYRASNFLALPEAIPTPRNRRFKQALASLDQVVYSLITERARQTEQPDDLLGMLLTARDEDTGQGMTLTQVRDEVITLLIAGHETVASALSWTWGLLSQHPGEQRHLLAELDSVLAGRSPEAADLPRLPVTRQVFDETLRLYPPAWLITRTAIDADRLGEYLIPPGSLIIISPYVIHRHPAFWANPEGYDPLRFASDAPPPPRFAYIPFGGGPRLCIGDRFALLEATLILATLSQHLRLDLLPGQSLDPLPLVTLRPRFGLKMKPVFRE